MTPKTDQETFDLVAKHLLTQNIRASEYGGCKYRTDTGLKCAVGCLIPDDRYTLHLEGQNVMGGTVYNLMTELGYTNRGFLMQLQQIHDYTPEETWPEKLTQFAEVNGLNTDIFSTFGEE